MRSIRSRTDASAPRSIAISSGRLTLARTFERGRDRLGHGRQLARREAHEGHARAVGVARAARAIPITIEGRAVAALQAVVLADDPFLHARLSSLDAVRARGSRLLGRRDRLDTAPHACSVPVFVRRITAGRLSWKTFMTFRSVVRDTKVRRPGRPVAGPRTPGLWRSDWACCRPPGGRVGPRAPADRPSCARTGTPPASSG